MTSDAKNGTETTETATASLDAAAQSPQQAVPQATGGTSGAQATLDLSAKAESSQTAPSSPASAPSVPSEAERALKEIEEQNRRVIRAKDAWEIAKEEASAAKKEFEKEGDELSRLISDHQHSAIQPKLPFGDAKTGALTQGPSEPKEPAVRLDDGSWRKKKLEDLALSESQLEKLGSVGVTTVGELADFTKLKGDFWYKEIKGFGKGAADKITAVLDEFWASLNLGGVNPTNPVKPAESSAETPADPSTIPADAPVGAISSAGPILVSETILSPSEIETACLEPLAALLKAGKTPEVAVLLYNDTVGRAPAGEYIVEKIVGNVATLLPVRSREEWLEVVAAYEAAHKADMPGKLAGQMILDAGDTSRKLTIGGEHEAILIDLNVPAEAATEAAAEPTPEAAPEPAEEAEKPAGADGGWLSPADLQMNPGEVEKYVHANLLADAPYAVDATDVEIPKLAAFILVPQESGENVPHIFVRGKAPKTYEVRAMVEPDGAKAHGGDPLLGRLAKIEDQTLQIGPVSFQVREE
jgi:hypothetical protein